MNSIRDHIGTYLRRKSVIMPRLYDFNVFGYASTDPAELLQSFCPNLKDHILGDLTSEFS